MSRPPIEEHITMALEAIRAELEYNALIIEEELRTNHLSSRTLRSDVYKTYRAIVGPVSLWSRIKCRLRGHEPVVCEMSCCRSEWEWCANCAVVRRARRPSPFASSVGDSA